VLGDDLGRAVRRLKITPSPLPFVRGGVVGSEKLQRENRENQWRLREGKGRGGGGKKRKVEGEEGGKLKGGGYEGREEGGGGVNLGGP